ncbi:amidohydrolase family protein [Botrimarina hoheduenensis]|uniref:Amidohydrolase n=1 Tax=Botrimarina hoheduenensis TaxID=2528000 RepID=A0A5C5WBU3_9BACT|nr:amidohydrolase family protein [Botrimarina hoheduenensis]TWT47559.1 Amidohydrolase [Botrimarina hoheduenensis]
MVIDSHHHFWRYDATRHGWIDPLTMSALTRDFLPQDLLAAAKEGAVEGFISVQAEQSLAETEWLLQLADQTAPIVGVVGWAPLVDPELESLLERIHHPKLKGFRHVVQDEPDDQFLLRADFSRGIACLTARDLVYDLLIFERHLPVAIELVDKHPEQRFVLDHSAKPKIAAGELSPWRENLYSLARRPNVVCKVSGLVTEAGGNDWTPAGLRPYLDTVLDAFGPERLMFGSDWPVCLLASSYERWLQTVQSWAASFTEAERACLFGATAAQVYRVDVSAVSTKGVSP